jgi:uncharacterized protein YbaP (TraB family)
MYRFCSFCIRTILVLVFILPLTTLAQQHQPPPGVFWRITGHQLSKPSYLLGTIHIPDKRVFNFGDSLYAAFEASEGYAMEVNPDSLMIGYFSDHVSNKENTFLKDTLSARDFARIKKKLQEHFKKPAEEITVSEFRGYFTDWRSLTADKGSMQTFMDAYLYNMARRQGKWVGGIEDVADQQNVLDNQLLETYIPELLNDRRLTKRFLEEMTRLYMEDDLDRLTRMLEKHKVTTDSIMLRRNRKMSDRIDSMARLRSTFFAIGTAHLSGMEGVISLLRKRGYTVTPVISSSRFHVNDYAFNQVELPWVPVQSNMGLYTAEMPGEPQKDNVGNEHMDMKLYADISTNLFYFTMGAIGNGFVNADSLVMQMVNNISKGAKITNVHAINKYGFTGKEMIAEAENITCRIQLFYHSPAVYLVMVGSPVAAATQCEDADRFFESFNMQKPKTAANPLWRQVSYNQFGFSITFPGKPNIKKLKGDEAGSIMKTIFSVTDPATGGYFQCVVQDMQRGYYLKNDTALFEGYINSMQNDYGAWNLRGNFDSIGQYPAMWADFLLKDNRDTFYNKTLNIHRGNRIYVLAVTVNKVHEQAPQIDSFFQSFSLIPVQESKWSMQPGPDKSFSTWAPERLRSIQDTTNAPGEPDLDYMAYDALAPATFFVSKLLYPAYFWAADDTSLLRREVDSRVEKGESLLHVQPVNNGRYTGVEALVRMADNHNLKKLRLLLVGDTLVNVYTLAAPEFLEKESSRRFFDDFSINHAPGPVTIFTNKAQQLVHALQSPDSATVNKAILSLKKVHFTKEDLPLLHSAMLERYRDSTHHFDISWELFQRVALLKDKSTLQVVEKEYGRLPASGKEVYLYDLLYLAAAAKNSESFTLIKKLLLQHPPQAGSNYQLFVNMNDTLELAATILPGLLPLLNDSLAGGKIVTLAERLLDSMLIDRKVIIAYKDALYAKAAAQVEKLQENRNAEGAFDNHALIRLLGKLKEPDAYPVIRAFLLQPNEHIAYTAIIALLKNDQPVPVTSVTKSAADPYYRLDLYNDLKKYKKFTLFPQVYLNRLAIAGPYEVQTVNIQTGLRETGIYWDKEYDAAGISRDLKEYLEAYEKAEEQP